MTEKYRNIKKYVHRFSDTLTIVMTVDLTDDEITFKSSYRFANEEEMAHYWKQYEAWMLMINDEIINLATPAQLQNFLIKGLKVIFK